MKTNILLLAALVIFGITSSCTNSNDKSEQEIVIEQSNIVTEYIPVNGMTCVGCEVGVEEKISQIKGIVSVKASHIEKEVVVEYDSTRTDINAIVQVITDFGFEPLGYY